MRPTAYKDTSVPAVQSQQDTKRLLVKYGCSAVSTAEDLTQGTITLRFARLMQDTEKPVIVRLTARLPDLPKIRTTYRDHSSPERKERERREKAERQAWRALYYAVKSRMESIVFGIETFEEAFLSHVEVIGRQGEKFTVGEWALPRLAQGQLKLTASTEG